MYINSMRGKLIFFVGFMIGFITTLLIFFNINIDEINLQSIEINNDKCNYKNVKLCNKKKYLSEINGELLINKNIKEIEYKKWLMKNNIEISNINMDYEQYGRKLINNDNKLLESVWLKNKINVICIVFVSKIKLARAINDTWGKNCNKLYFFSDKLINNEIPVIKLKIKLTSSWQLLCEVMNYVWKIDNKLLQWTIFINDDTMILMENLRYFIANLDYNDGYYLGYPIELWGQIYNVAQAGYVLSRGAYKKIIETFDNHDKCQSSGRYWKKQDFYLGKHLSMFNIHPLDTRDYRMRGIFHGYSLNLLLWGVEIPSNYFTHALYPSDSNNCCSPKSITFTVAESDKLYTFNYILYNLNVYNRGGYYGNKLAPTTISETEIWKLALKDEFNITYFDNITDKRYYDIWRSRYSEPSQFINQNYIHKFQYNKTNLDGQ